MHNTRIAHKAASWVQCLLMTPSPFHGIFSAFSQEYGGIPTTQAASKLPVEQTSVQQPVAGGAASGAVGQIAVDIY